MLRTDNSLKIGQVEYECSLARSNEYQMEYQDSRLFATAREAEQWGLTEIRKRNKRDAGEYTWDGWIRRIMWIEDRWYDDAYGTIIDAEAIYDRIYNSYSAGVTWRDDHAPGDAPEWETA